MGSGYSVASSVEGFSSIAERRGRVGRTKSAIQPAKMRSDADRLGDRRRERFTIRSWCLPSNRVRAVMKWMKRTTKLRIAES